MSKQSKKATPVTIEHRRNPFQLLQNELERVVSNFYNVAGISRYSFENFENLILHPSIDIVDDKENFKVEVEMPGLGEENIKVSIRDGMLTISGEKETSRKDEGKNYSRREIAYGRYERSIPLPDSVDTNKAKASFKKGMLWINIPKKPESIKQSRELKIEKADV